MEKKHYFLNSIYLTLCATFIVLASILNFNDSVAKQEVKPTDTGIYLGEQDSVEDNSKTNFSVREKNTEKYESDIASSYQSTVKIYRSNNAGSQAPATISYSSYINIAGRILRIEDVDDTLIDSTDHVNRWGKKFLYGHNTSGVFGPIRNLSAGATFTALIDGEEHTYQIVYTETMEKPKVEKNMLGIAYAMYNGNRYDLSLMTCAGTSLGGGDATHRFVVFANRIS